MIINFQLNEMDLHAIKSALLNDEIKNYYKFLEEHLNQQYIVIN